jgi:hypothetical protein
VIEVKSLLDETLCTLNERKEENFVAMKVKEILSEDEISENMARKFNAEAADFFDTAIDYLRKWSSVMGHMDSFKWMILNTVPKWCYIENTLSYLKTKKVQLSDAEVFDQFVCLKTFVSTNIGAEEYESTNMQDKWLKFFQTVNHL